MRILLILIICCIFLPAEELTYPIVDSGVVRCYDNREEISFPKPGDRYFGQDGNYLGNEPTYRDNGNGTISDLVTGLMWQQDPGVKMTWEAAVKNASSFELAGHKDWRLPSIKELYSLIVFTGFDIEPGRNGFRELTPFIDTRYFNFSYGDSDRGERIIDSQFASSTRYVSTTMGGNETMFGVNFADGRIKGYPIYDRHQGKAKKFYVLYVRGNPEYGRNKLNDNGDGTITDLATGLTWCSHDSGFSEKRNKGLTWQQALAWAEDLEFAGKKDWRLPGIKELQSIVDYSRSPDTTGSPAISPLFKLSVIRDAAGDKNYPYIWSSTSHLRKSSAESACYIAFGEAQGWMPRPGGMDYVLQDVHGAGAQRSDPKNGDPDDYPRGHGPQGDIVRIYNRVLCVRGGRAVLVTSGPKPVLKHRSSPSAGPSGGGGPPQPGTGKQDEGRFIKRHDRDNDGRVSREEFPGPSDHFREFDKDGDGYIDASEAPTGPPPPR